MTDNMNEREIAEKMIADAEKLAADGKAKLEALDRLKLRHGDYGTTNLGCSWFCAKKCGTLELFSSFGGSGYKGVIETLPKGYTRLGNIIDNIIDDLKQDSMDLTKFKVDKMVVSLGEEDNSLVFDLDGENRYSCVFSFAELVEIHQKLGQMLATAKRMRGKKHG